MSGITASLRFSGKLNGDLRKMGVNLVPFPRLHFFALGQAPLFSPTDASHVNVTVQELTDQMWSSRNFLANIKPENGKYLTASVGFRGKMATQEVDDEVAKVWLYGALLLFFFLSSFFFTHFRNHSVFIAQKQQKNTDGCCFD